MLFGRRGAEPVPGPSDGSAQQAGTAAQRLAALVRDSEDAIYAKSLGGMGGSSTANSL